jgi:hypothetical protein
MYIIQMIYVFVHWIHLDFGNKPYKKKLAILMILNNVKRKNS